MSNLNDQLYEKWDKWIDVLGDEITNLWWQRLVYSGVREIVSNNAEIHEPGDFFFWLSVWYSSSMAVAVRRLADRDSDSVSYRRLLEGIRDNPQVLSRTRFKQRFVDGVYMEFQADLDLDNHIGPGRDCIDPALVAKEISELESRTASLKHYVDKRVAHRDKKEVVSVPAHKELEDAVDFLWALHRRYYPIFRSWPFGDFPSFGYDWKQVFQQAWLPSEEPERRAATFHIQGVKTSQRRSISFSHTLRELVSSLLSKAASLARTPLNLSL